VIYRCQSGFMLMSMFLLCSFIGFIHIGNSNCLSLGCDLGHIVLHTVLSCEEHLRSDSLAPHIGVITPDNNDLIPIPL
jgi:hypothetical protein